MSAPWHSTLRVTGREFEYPPSGEVPVSCGELWFRCGSFASLSLQFLRGRDEKSEIVINKMMDRREQIQTCDLLILYLMLGPSDVWSLVRAPNTSDRN